MTIDLYKDMCDKHGYFQKNNVLFFQKGPLSQWFGGYKDQPSSKIKLSNNLEFNCAEQFMMFCKAYHFDDADTAEKILMESRPDLQKKLGKTVKDFDHGIWDKFKMNYVYKGTVMKYTQNKHLSDILLSIPDNVFIAENAPWDNVWGCGKYENIEDSSTWTGTNFLGIILTRVKIELKMESLMNNGVIKPVYYDYEKLSEI